MNGDRVYRFAREVVGITPKTGEAHGEFIGRLGAAITKLLDNDQAAGQVIAAIELDDTDDPTVRQLTEITMSQRHKENLTDLEVDRTECRPEERRDKIDKLYSPKTTETVSRLYSNKAALGLLAAPETQELAYRDFLYAAKGYAESSYATTGKHGRFASLQRLAGTARYELAERDAMCTLDLDTLSIIRTKIEDQELKYGPVIRKLLQLNIESAYHIDKAPARMALDATLEEGASQLGYTVGGAISRGYLAPAQTALVVDFTRVINELRLK